jgi:hypothetical protein
MVSRPVWYAEEAALPEGFVWGEAAATQQIVAIAIASKLAENREARIFVDS